VEFSIGTNWDNELPRRLAAYREVTDLFGVNSKSVMGAGRPIPRVLDRKEMEAHFRAVHDAGMTFSYLFNAPTMGGREFLPQTNRKLLDEMRWLLDHGVEHLVIAIPYVIELVKERFPQFKVKASYNAKIRNLELARSFAAVGADLICVDHTIHRNFPLVRALTANLEIPIQMVVGSTTMRSCPNFNALYHASNECSLTTEGRTIDRHNLNSINYCFSWCHVQKIGHPENVLKSGFIRPEDLHLYEEAGVSHFKMATRGLTGDEIERRVAAYAARRYDGNLLDIITVFPYVRKYAANAGTARGAAWQTEHPAVKRFFDLKFDRDFSGIMRIDNRQLDGYLDKFVREACGPSCKSCRWCNDWAAKAVEVDRTLYDEFVETLTAFRTALARSEHLVPASGPTGGGD
jgi:collagenase-like PrtC family protease